MSRSLIQITLPNGGNVAWLVPYRDLDAQPWFELLRPLADLIPEGEWTATPVPEDETDRQALAGH